MKRSLPEPNGIVRRMWWYPGGKSPAVRPTSMSVTSARVISER